MNIKWGGETDYMSLRSFISLKYTDEIKNKSFKK